MHNIIFSNRLNPEMKLSKSKKDMINKGSRQMLLHSGHQSEAGWCYPHQSLLHHVGGMCRCFLLLLAGWPDTEPGNLMCIWHGESR